MRGDAKTPAGHSFAMAELMEELLATTLAVIWSRFPWQCTYRKTADVTWWVVLSYGRQVALKRQVASIEEMRDTADLWKHAIFGADLPLLLDRAVLSHLPDQRRVPDRRRVPRGGRRDTDLWLSADRRVWRLRPQ
jgi:hypothetical protein